MTTIREAKKKLRENWERGINCPCCGQMVKLYKRKLYAIQARGLIELYKLDQTESKYYHIREIEGKFRGSGGGDFAKLRYWKLIEEKPNEDDPSKRTSGMWQITDRGRDFVLGNVKVRSHMTIFDGKFQGLEGDLITIQEALGKKFNYSELMK